MATGCTRLVVDLLDQLFEYDWRFGAAGVFAVIAYAKFVAMVAVMNKKANGPVTNLLNGDLATGRYSFEQVG